MKQNELHSKITEAMEGVATQSKKDVMHTPHEGPKNAHKTPKKAVNYSKAAIDMAAAKLK